MNCTMTHTTTANVSIWLVSCYIILTVNPSYCHLMFCNFNSESSTCHLKLFYLLSISTSDISLYMYLPLMGVVYFPAAVVHPRTAVDDLNDEFRRKISGAEAMRPKPKTQQVAYIAQDSSNEEICYWLQYKGFSYEWVLGCRIFVWQLRRNNERCVIV